MRALLTLIACFTFVWAAGLTWFVRDMARAPLPLEQKTEAIIVLTGGQGRVERGLEALAAGSAPVLFVSGVGEQVKVSELLIEHARGATRKAILAAKREIVLDRISRSTVANANHSSDFLKERAITHIRLITASYHMRRSVREFRTANPELRILEDPVFPEGFRYENWWTHDNTRRLVFSEFYKYIAILTRDMVRP